MNFVGFLQFNPSVRNIRLNQHQGAGAHRGLRAVVDNPGKLVAMNFNQACNHKQMTGRARKMVGIVPRCSVVVKAADNENAMDLDTSHVNQPAGQMVGFHGRYEEMIEYDHYLLPMPLKIEQMNQINSFITLFMAAMVLFYKTTGPHHFTGHAGPATGFIDEYDDDDDDKVIHKLLKFLKYSILKFFQNAGPLADESLDPILYKILQTRRCGLVDNSVVADSDNEDSDVAYIAAKSVAHSADEDSVYHHVVKSIADSVNEDFVVAYPAADSANENSTVGYPAAKSAMDSDNEDSDVAYPTAKSAVDSDNEDSDVAYPTAKSAADSANDNAVKYAADSASKDFAFAYPAAKSAVDSAIAYPAVKSAMDSDNEDSVVGYHVAKSTANSVNGDTYESIAADESAATKFDAGVSV
ncbi:hypothetical protein C2S51_004999 [Perilla frutescens var. frutescens]|nr:hypothetical protein C2S51_004999 [Perilla frutescens var. frutescens]